MTPQSSRETVDLWSQRELHTELRAQGMRTDPVHTAESRYSLSDMCRLLGLEDMLDLESVLRLTLARRPMTHEQLRLLMRHVAGHADEQLIRTLLDRRLDRAFERVDRTLQRLDSLRICDLELEERRLALTSGLLEILEREVSLQERYARFH